MCNRIPLRSLSWLLMGFVLLPAALALPGADRKPDAAALARKVDDLLKQEWAAAQITPVGRSSDAEFMRRAYRRPVKDAEVAFDKSPGDFQFAAAVASFGMLLRNSQYRGTASFDNVLELADGSLVPGFLCEPEALDGAREITTFGGWRAALSADPH